MKHLRPGPLSLLAMLSLFTLSAHAEVPGDCVSVPYEGEIETVNGLPATLYTLPRLKFHVIFHPDGTVSYTESALLKINDPLGERTAIGNWEADEEHSIQFTLFQSAVDQTNVLLTGCGNYACKNTILGVLDFTPNCSGFTFNWHQTIIGADGEPVPSLFYSLGTNYVFSAGSGVRSSMDDVRTLFDRLGIPRP